MVLSCYDVSIYRLSKYNRCTTDLFTVSVVLYFSRMSYTCVCMCQLLSCIQLFAILWTVAHHTPLSIGFSRQKSWNGLPILFPGDFPNLGIEPRSPALQADSLLSEVPGSPVTYLESYSTHYFLSLSKMHLIFSHVISCLDSSFLLKQFENLCPHKTCIQIYSSFINNCSNLGATKMYFSRGMGKLYYSHTMECFSY